MKDERKAAILRLVDLYHRGGKKRKKRKKEKAPKRTRLSPFIARYHGRLHKVAKKIRVPVKELDEVLTIMDKPGNLPYDHLMG